MSIKFLPPGMQCVQIDSAFERMADEYRKSRDVWMWMAMKLARARGDKEWVYNWKQRREFDEETEKAIRKAKEGGPES